MTIHKSTNVLAIVLMVLLAATFASAQVVNCGNAAACNTFSVTATGGTLFQHNDLGHDGNGNVTSFNNAAISTSSATGFTSPATVNSGIFRAKSYCATTAVCPAGTNIGQLQVGTGLPISLPFQTPQLTLYYPDVFNSTYSTLATTGYPGAPECGGVTNATAVSLFNTPCGSFVVVTTNGACAKFGPNSQGDTIPKCTGTTPGAGGYIVNDWCDPSGTSVCAFIGRFKTGLPIAFATDNNGNSFLAGEVVGVIPSAGYNGTTNVLLYKVSCALVVTTAADNAAWTNGHETILTATINGCS